MTKIKPLPTTLLRRKLQLSQLNFTNTNEIKQLVDHVGQERALHAIMFGIDIKQRGYNLFAMGPLGMGKFTLIQNILKKKAKKSHTPSDWCYVHNFEIPEKPIAIKLPHGRGFIFQQDMKSFINELGFNIAAIFESKEHHHKTQKIKQFYDKKRKLAKKLNLVKKEETTPLYKQQYKREQKLKKQVVSYLVKPAIVKLKKKYAKFKSVLKYLTAVQEDIINHVDDFINQDEKTNLISFSLENPSLVKYKINLLVDHRKLKGAPVVFEPSPNYSSLICRIEYTNIEGNLTTNFSLIKAGALHYANGGYLIIEARKLRKNREAWEALKSALFSQKITIKPMEHEAESFKPVSLEPMTIPLNVKVILKGERNTYYSLCQHDPDFIELFKVAVDFDEIIQRNQKNINIYAKLIANIIKQNKLLPFNVSGVARVIDHSSRIADDVEKLSLHISYIRNLIIEADYWAKKNKKNIVRAVDVKQAIIAKVHRMDRSKELYDEDIKRNFIIIRTSGKLVGQVNGLSVRRVGDFAYGHPTRITARVRLGRGKVIDIQREIKMAGPLHSKAVLIITQFLASRFNQDQPFALLASIAFEQIYCWTEGDSASVGEICALLSALAEIPILQHLAVTGSIDQYGEVQAIGGVNEKIEGFFDTCKEKGFNGKQGVLIPTVNIQNLMLREDVVAAAKSKKFFIYPIETVDEAITLLTGFTAGKRNSKGLFPANTIYQKIEARLQKFVKNRRTT